MYAPGELINERHGVFFMDVSNGSVTGYRAPDDKVSGGRFYHVSRGHAAVLALGLDHHILHIPSGTTWQYDPGESWPWVLADSFVVMLDRTRPGSGPLIVDLRTGSSRRVNVSTFDAHPLLSDDERYLVLAAWAGGSTDPEITIIDLRSDTWVKRTIRAPMGTKDGRFLRFSASRADGGFSYELWAGDPGMFVFGSFMTWDGVDEVTTRSGGRVRSPNGQSVAMEEVLAGVRFGGFGTPIGWTAVTIETAAASFRIRSAHIPSPRPWLADSSGVLVQVGEPDDPAARGSQNARAAVLRVVDGRPMLERLPEGVAAVTPCPSDSGLFATRSPGVYNARTGALVSVNLAAEVSYSMDDPWATRSDQVAFLVPYFGPGEGPGEPLLLAPVFEASGAANEMAFQVVARIDCLNLRKEPRRDSEVLACLPPLTTLTLARHPARDTLPGSGPDPSTKDASHDFDETDLWVYVRTPDGPEGWCVARYLEWAVGEKL